MPNLDQTVEKEMPSLFWLDGFEGLNTRDARNSIEDQQCAWIENFIPIGKGNARTMFDAATAIYTAATPIVYDYSFDLAGVDYKLLVLSDGSAKQIRLSDGAATTVATAGTFTVSPTLPAAAQYGISGLLIVDSTNFWAWDGATLFNGSNTFAPAWLTDQPVLVMTGDTHTSTTIDNISNTSQIVVGMRVTDVTHGDVPASTVVLTVATNSVTISNATTGSHTADTLNFGWALPTGVAGQCIEVYSGHVWIGNGPTITFSAPGNGAVFSTAQGGGSFTSTDGHLVSQYMNLRQANGFLYLFGDGEIAVISNVQTSGSPATTTFNNQVLDEQTGLGWRDAITPFGRALCFANASGVYALFGGAAEKVSDDIDTLFQDADFSVVTPTMFAATIFSIRCTGLVLNTLDPTTSTQRTMILLWTGKKWFVGSQSRVTIFGSDTQDMGSPAGWGNDGTHVYKLFATASDSLTKKIQTKLWAGRSNLVFKNTMRVYAETVNGQSAVALAGTLDSDRNAGVAFTLNQSELTLINNALGVLTLKNNGNSTLTLITQPSGVAGQDADQSGLRLGVTLTSTGADFQLVGVGEIYNESTPYA